MYVTKLARKLQKIFAFTAPTSEITVFGSTTLDNPTFSRDPNTIQSDIYEGGWFPETLTGNIRPYAEDMNGLHFVHSYQLAYLLQSGIPEWELSTPYFKNCICRIDGTLYISIADNNTGNNPITTTGYWSIFNTGTNDFMPVGASLEWNGTQLPSNGKWLYEQGQALSTSTYSQLFSVIGYTFGGSGTSFNLPNSVGRVAIGLSSAHTALARLGNTGGIFNHTHTVFGHRHSVGNLSITASGSHTHGVLNSEHRHYVDAHQHKKKRL